MLISLLKALRPQQWVKNLAILAPAFFAGQINIQSNWGLLAWAFVILSAASSGSYLINDVFDREHDRLDPLKSHRPIAAGILSPWLASAVGAFLLGFSLVSAGNLPRFFFDTVVAFVLLQLAYTIWLKRVILLDVMAIAATFSLRVFAGAFILLVPLSSWLILTTISLSLLLAIGKRRAEVTLLHHRLAARSREVLRGYPTLLLDGLIFMMASATIVVYSFFTFNQPEKLTRIRLSDLLPQTLANPKWLMITIPFVIYGIFRYLYVVYEKKEGRSPERVLIYDLPLLATVIGWAVASYIALYVITR